MPKLKIEAPARYLIRIQGHLDANWRDRLGGLSIFSTLSADGSTITTLIGIVADQAALLGVLNTLYDLRYPLLSVNYLTDGEEMDAGE